MKTIPYAVQNAALQRRYPNAYVEAFDNAVMPLTREGWNTLHSEFHFWLGETYKDEVCDCDDFMREFHAYVKRRHRATGKDIALGCYDLIYFIGANYSRKHAINSVWVIEGDKLFLSELEPQPNGGLKQCSELERASASACLG